MFNSNSKCVDDMAHEDCPLLENGQSTSAQKPNTSTLSEVSPDKPMQKSETLKSTHSAKPILENSSFVSIGLSSKAAKKRRMSNFWEYTTKTMNSKTLSGISTLIKSSNKMPYDDEYKKLLVEENNGLRVWYDDYSSIDWIHDFVKERVRLRKLRSAKGLSGYMRNLFDSSQAWILVALVGIVSGTFAATIDLFTNYFTYFKYGYCSTNIFFSYSKCCKGRKNCFFWRKWSSLIPSFGSEAHDGKFLQAATDFLVYFVITVTLAISAGALVMLTKSKSNINQNIKANLTENTNKRKKSKPYFYYAAGSGIPEVKTILGGFVIRGFLGIRTLFVKTFALILAVSSGMSLGKEGPLVHISCCIGNVLSKIFHKYNNNEGKRREMLSASAAAGVAVAFGAPIGGVLFSLEEVSYYFPNKTMIRSFVCALIAALTLKLYDPFGTGKIVLFQIQFDQNWHILEIFVFIIIGLFGGLYGALYCKLNIAWCKRKRNSWVVRYPMYEVFCVAVITAIINYLNKYTRLGGTELVAELFQECTGKHNSSNGLCSKELSSLSYVVVSLIYAIVVKFFESVITFGIKVPAGIFIPSMCIGASFGRILGLLGQSLQQSFPGSMFFKECGIDGKNCITPGVYAVVGATAALTGVTRTTISLVVIMFELTESLTYTLPIMLAVMVSKWTADAFVSASIYENLIEINDYPFLDSRKEYINTKPLKEMIETSAFECIQIRESNTWSSLYKKVETLRDIGYEDAGFPILNGQTLVGYIAENELEHALISSAIKSDNAECIFRSTSNNNREEMAEEACSSNDFTPFIDQAPITVSSGVSVDVVVEMFIKLGIRYLCVVENERYVGIIHKKRLLACLHEC